MKTRHLITASLLLGALLSSACKDDEKEITIPLPPNPNNVIIPNDNEDGGTLTLSATVAPGAIGTDGLTKKDNYRSYSSWSSRDSWNLANVHDPSVVYYNGYYYMYGTDASFGNEHDKAPHGKHFQGKRSKDLVNWGWVGGPFDKAPDWMLDSINSFRSKMGLEGTLTYDDIKDQLGYWAPVVRVVDGKIRMYYS
ncbi:MAG: hypothetical protein IJ150_04830, partial [Bacteroidales bacterium]|nr:hypothetical protein [Bacteroidales bacterium]